MTERRIHTTDEQDRVAAPETAIETERVHQPRECPERSGSLVTDEAHGETVCEGCGLVGDEVRWPMAV